MPARLSALATARLAPVLAVIALAFGAMPDRVLSQEARQPSHCIAIAQTAPGLEYLHRASWNAPLPDSETVRLHYIDHASFLIRTAGGLSAVTDFTGFIGSAPLIPDIVTMNHAHTSHWTSFPDPEIRHVLRGWGETPGAGVEHHLDLGEMLVRNVSTDIRSDFGGRENRGNSIFIFEVAGLCIGHLGHLHHEPSPEQYAAIGRLDVVMAPVDGGLTLDLPTMIGVLKRLRSSVVIPMHWFSEHSLGRFLSGIGDEFAIELRDGPAMEVSLRSLPSRPTVVVLRPQWLTED